MSDITLISKDKILDRIKDLAHEINKYYRNNLDFVRSGEPLVIIGVLNGAFMFLSDLVKHLSIPVKIDFVKVSDGKLISPPRYNLHDDYVLIVEDILDTGKTLQMLISQLSWNYPENIKIAVLLNKPYKTKFNIKADFIGFNIPDVFVWGYGLDNNGLSRGRQSILYEEKNELKTGES